MNTTVFSCAAAYQRALQSSISTFCSSTLPLETKLRPSIYSKRRHSVTTSRLLRRPAVLMSPPLIDVKVDFDPTDRENSIFQRLLRTISHFNIDTQLRVAGGWVRDKLLGKECFDIDVAIDNMLGREFCEKVTEYLSSIGEEVRGAAIVPRNPEQSKHLETATMRICDMWIDFVNLRSEDYNENSRIPTMKFGTAKEDAYRRDLTINSLFYNINTGLVEDFTGRGLADLRTGKIMTPLPPRQTFLDDPLRVLRAIRFGARFDFELDDELVEAASCDDVVTALSHKISRERIGHEIDLMVSGNLPVVAMNHIYRMKLFEVVFKLPCNMDTMVEEFGRDCVCYMEASHELMLRIGLSNFSEEQIKLCLYASMFLPQRKVFYSDINGKKKKHLVIDYLFRESLKLKSSYADSVIAIHTAMENFSILIPQLMTYRDAVNEQVNWGRSFLGIPHEVRPRIFAGLVLREIKELWRVALVVCLVENRKEEVGDALVEKRRGVFDTVQLAILQFGLDKVWEMKPLLNGRDIIKTLQLKSGGPLVKEWQERVVEWQLGHPLGTAGECMEWMTDSCTKRPKLE